MGRAPGHACPACTGPERRRASMRSASYRTGYGTGSIGCGPGRPAPPETGLYGRIRTNPSAPPGAAESCCRQLWEATGWPKDRTAYQLQDLAETKLTICTPLIQSIKYFDFHTPFFYLALSDAMGCFSLPDSCTVAAVLILHQQCLERVAMAVERACDRQCWVPLVQSAADELPLHVPLDLHCWTLAE